MDANLIVQSFDDITGRDSFDDQEMSADGDPTALQTAGQNTEQWTDDGWEDIDTAATRCLAERRFKQNTRVMTTIHSEEELLEQMRADKLQNACAGAPIWTAARWSSFNTEEKVVRIGKSTLSLPGLRTTAEVSVDYMASTKFTDNFSVLTTIGNGSYGIVLRCREAKSDKIVAVKALKMSKLKDPASFLKEVAVARRLNHQHIVKLEAVFRDQDMLYLVMENLRGGDFTLILKRNPSGVNTNLVIQWSFALLQALAYLHHHRLLHRDVKPANILLENMGENHPIKLIDFGLSVHVKKGELLNSRAGTLFTMAPEMVKGLAYSETVDVWSAGCVVFELCTGHMPYTATSFNNLALMIETMSVVFVRREWNRHPKKVRELVVDMLDRDHTRRKKAKEILTNSLFAAEAPLKNQRRMTLLPYCRCLGKTNCD